MDGGMRELLAEQCGVVSRRQALRHLSADAIKRRIAAGRWQVPHRGVYVTHTGPIGRPEQRWVAVLAAGAGRAAVLGGLSALESLGFRPLRSLVDTSRRHDVAGEIHVLVPADVKALAVPAAVVVHRTSKLPGTELHHVGRPPCTNAARSVIDAAQWASSDDRAAAVAAACFQQRLVGAAEVEAVLYRLRRARRRGLIRGLIRDLDGGAHSLPEVEFVRLCRGGGLPQPKLQVSRRDAGGRQRFLDGYFDGFGVHVEVDGGQHLDPTAWWADMRRQNELWIPGDRVLRFPAWVVRNRPAEVLAQVHAALWAAGWRPSRRTDPLA